MIEKSDQIMVKFSTNYPGLFRNVSKFILYLNTLFSRGTKGNFYIEIVEDGNLYIYKNKATFELLNPKISRTEISSLIKNKKLDFSPDMLIDGIINKQTFPEHGIDFQYNFFGAHKQYSYNKQLSFHQNFFGEGLKISTSKKYDLILSIMDFDDFYLYIQQIALLASGLTN